MPRIKTAAITHAYLLELINVPSRARSLSPSLYFFSWAGCHAVRQEFLAHSRPSAFKALVILTDGEWNEGPSPLNETDAMKKEGVHIFTVAVGEASTPNVQALASTPLSKYYFNVTTELELPSILHKMVGAMCTCD